MEAWSGPRGALLQTEWEEWPARISYNLPSGRAEITRAIVVQAGRLHHKKNQVNGFSGVHRESDDSFS